MTRTTTKLMSAALALALAACSNTPKADTATPEPSAATPESAPAPEPKPEVKPIPEGFHAVTPQIVVKGVDAAVDFYVKNLGAQTLLTMPGPDGKAVHAEIRLGDSVVMIDEEDPASGMKSPQSLGGSPVALMTYVPDADALVAGLLAAGAKAVYPVEEMFWGDRVGEIVDPFGHRWALATHVEDLTPEQIDARAKLAFAPPKGKKPKKGAPPAWKQVVGTPATATVPPDYRTITPVVTVADAAAAVEFYKQAFGAGERARMPSADGKKLMHVEVLLGDSVLMLSDSFPEMGTKSVSDFGGSPVSLHYYVTDVDAVYAAAQAAGAKPIMPVEDMFWGDRYGAVVDPAGLVWGIATHKEDLTPEQIEQRHRESMQKAKPAS
ncbi:MAG TPA: VOC family protein [Nannocystis sp.]